MIVINGNDKEDMIRILLAWITKFNLEDELRDKLVKRHEEDKRRRLLKAG